MPLLRQRQQIAIKQEATAGTAETLAAADAIMHTGIATYDPDVLMTPRESMTASVSHRGSVVGTQAAKIGFKMYLRGSYSHTTGAVIAPSAGVTDPDFAVPMKGCGLAQTVSAGVSYTYTPSSTTIVDETTGAYCTVTLYEDGKAYKIHGAVGNVVLTLQVGMPILAEFEFTGLYNAPTDTALLSGIVYPTFAEPPFLSAALSLIGSYATAKIGSLKLDLGNTIAMRAYPNTATGFFTAQITGRKPSGSLDPEEVLAATNNFFSQWIAGTSGAITTGTFPSTGTTFNKFSLTIPAAMYQKVGRADRDGIGTAPLDFEPMANSAAGDDEFTLVNL
jgi:hypothetical protein